MIHHSSHAGILVVLTLVLIPIIVFFFFAPKVDGFASTYGNKPLFTEEDAIRTGLYRTPTHNGWNCRALEPPMLTMCCPGNMKRVTPNQRVPNGFIFQYPGKM